MRELRRAFPDTADDGLLQEALTFLARLPADRRHGSSGRPASTSGAANIPGAPPPRGPRALDLQRRRLGQARREAKYGERAFPTSSSTQWSR